MKFIAAAASTLVLINGAASQVCPDSNSLEEWDQMELNDGDGTLTFNYAVVLATSSDERSILCARLESDMESFIGFGISPDGTMAGGEAVIGLPDDGTVKKYILGNVERVKLMSDEKQTLMNTNITQADGKTFMEFAKYLVEEEENVILANGENVFLYALGNINELGYHKTNKGGFTVDFEMTPKTTPETPPSPTPDPPTPDTPPPTQPSGATARQIACTMVLGAGAAVFWFGL